MLLVYAAVKCVLWWCGVVVRVFIINILGHSFATGLGEVFAVDLNIRKVFDSVAKIFVFLVFKQPSYGFSPGYFFNPSHSAVVLHLFLFSIFMAASNSIISFSSVLLVIYVVSIFASSFEPNLTSSLSLVNSEPLYYITTLVESD